MLTIKIETTIDETVARAIPAPHPLFGRNVEPIATADLSERTSHEPSRHDPILRRASALCWSAVSSMRRWVAGSLVLIAACVAEDDYVDVPTSPHCDEVDDAAWPAIAVTLETELLELINQQRRAGATCRGVAMPAVPPLVSRDSLRCAARLHSADMAKRDFFSHTNPDGLTQAERFTMAGYPWAVATEDILRATSTSQETFDAIMASENGHCESVMSADIAETGIGHVQGATFNTLPYWTLAHGNRKRPGE